MSTVVTPGAGDHSYPPGAFETEVDLLAAAVQGVVGVVAVGGGGPLQPTTYLPGRRVAGIRSSTDRIEVAVTVAVGLPAPVVAGRIRTALAVLAPGTPVDVHIADLQLPQAVTQTTAVVGPR